MKDDLDSRPQGRAFSFVRRSFTTAFVASFILLFVLPLIAAGLVKGLGSLPFLQSNAYLAAFISSAGICSTLVNLILFIASIIILSFSRRARHQLIFWLGCCISPILAVLGICAGFMPI